MNKDLYERGLAIRKAVLGHEYVERALASADAFTQPLQEIMETLLQVAIYAGVPAAVDSFRIAREAFSELEAEKKTG